MKKKSSLVLAVVLLLSLMMYSGHAGNAGDIDYPKKEIILVVPFNAGGAVDLMARQLQPVFKELLNVDIVVQNIAGAGSVVGVTEVMNSKPDGYKLGIITSSYVSMDAQKRVPKSITDAVWISSLSEDPMILAVKTGGKYDNVEDLIQAALENPGEIIIGQMGTNNPMHAFAEIFMEVTGAKFKNLPYDGSARTLTELMGGHIDAGVFKPADVVGQLKSGEIKAVGTFTREKVEMLEEVPTLLSLGYDVFKYGDINMSTYIFAPIGLDEGIREKLAEMFTIVLTSEQWQTIAQNRGFISNPISGQELEKLVFNEIYPSFVKIGKELYGVE